MNDSLLSRFEVTEAKRPLLKIAGFTGKDFKLGRLMYPHRMRAERLFVAAATTVLWFPATPVPAQERAAIMRACAGDIARLCAGVQPSRLSFQYPLNVQLFSSWPF
jgi:hypothetical protein